MVEAWRRINKNNSVPDSPPPISREPSLCLPVAAPWKGSCRASRLCTHSFMLTGEPAVQPKQVHLILYWCEQIIDDTSALFRVSIKDKKHWLILNRTTSCWLIQTDHNGNVWGYLRAGIRVPARVQRQRNMCTVQVQLLKWVLYRCHSAIHELYSNMNRLRRGEKWTLQPALA